MGTDQGPRDGRKDPRERRDEEPPPAEDRPGGVDPEEQVADGPAGATEARTPGMGE
jgi:hypothetical protein